MYYYNKKSRRKIIHLMKCFHICRKDIDSIGWFETLAEAYEKGYRLCKHCSPLVKQYKKEKDKIVEFCYKNGLSVYPGNKNISIETTMSKWKLALDKKNRIVLYHRNNFIAEKDSRSEIRGYHLQGDARRHSIAAYLEYIVNHDGYRVQNPLYIPKKKKELPPPRKGTRRYRSLQNKREKYERRKAIENVLGLIESLRIPSPQMPLPAMC